MGEVSACMCERDRMVKRVRRGGSRKADGCCLITCLAIWTVVTELHNPIHYLKCLCVCVCTNRKQLLFIIFPVSGCSSALFTHRPNQQSAMEANQYIHTSALSSPPT